MSFSELISPFVGRVVLAWFFISSALTLGGQWEATATLMAFNNIPAPKLLLAGAIVVMMLGGISLVLGFYARAGALALFGFTIAASILMHDYWDIRDHIARTADYDIFARNMAIAGGLLLIVGMGAGPFSVDNTLGAGGGKKR
jgi:putative oxidoreductase